MSTLKLRRGDEVPPRDGGSYGELVAWFSEMVICLDKGDLPGAVAAQAHIESHGFKVTFRRRPPATKRSPSASRLVPTPT